MSTKDQKGGKPQRKRKQRSGRAELLQKAEARSQRDMEIAILSQKGVEPELLATKFEVSERTVYRAIKKFDKFFKSLVDIEEFNTVKTQIHDAVQLELLKSMMASEKLDKASVRDLATSYGIIFDKQRLQQGKSTSNHEVKQTNYTVVVDDHNNE